MTTIHQLYWGDYYLGLDVNLESRTKQIINTNMYETYFPLAKYSKELNIKVVKYDLKCTQHLYTLRSFHLQRNNAKLKFFDAILTRNIFTDMEWDISPIERIDNLMLKLWLAYYYKKGLSLQVILPLNHFPSRAESHGDQRLDYVLLLEVSYTPLDQSLTLVLKQHALSKQPEEVNSVTLNLKELIATGIPNHKLLDIIEEMSTVVFESK
jgi:hypothetical protein